MAAASFRDQLQDTFTCTVCLDLYKDPVVLDCGHSFCRACITKSLQERPGDTACPQCGARVPASGRLTVSRVLRNTAESLRALNELRRQEPAGGADCEWHQEPLKLFCQDDQALICEVCFRSSKHRAHRMESLEEAAKDQICQLPHILRKEKESISGNIKRNAEESQILLGRLQAERGKVAAAFSPLPQFLEEQEKLWQAQMEEVEKEIVGRRDEYQARLSAELSSLDSLQNLGDILERCKRGSFENPEAFPEALKGRIRDLPDLNSFVEGIMKRFQDSLVFRLQFQKDGKSVRSEGAVDEPPAHPEAHLPTL